MTRQSKRAVAWLVAAALLTTSVPSRAEPTVIVAVFVGFFGALLGAAASDSRREARSAAWYRDAYGVINLQRRTFRSGLSLKEAQRARGVLVDPERWAAIATNSGLHELLTGPKTYYGIEPTPSGARREAIAWCENRTFLGGCQIVRIGSTKFPDGRPR